MRIGIDCRLAGQAHAGIGRYIQNLVVRLPHLAPEIEWVYFFHDQAQADTVLHGQDFKRQPEVVLASVKHYSLAEQTQLPALFKQQHLDLLHIPHFNIPFWYSGRLIVTIHDLLWHEYRGSQVTTLSPWQYWLKYWGYRWITRQAVKKASRILVPAHFVEKTLLKYYPWAKPKVRVTKEGVEAIFLRHKSLHSEPIPKVSSLLYVGSLYPHKNLSLVIEALHQLPTYKLIVVGSRSVFLLNLKQFVETNGLKSRVVFKGSLSDAELAELYPQVTALVQPSLSEGFGLTGLEAMAQGVPVLASQIPVFQEIYQNGAIFFNPCSVQSFVEAVNKLMSADRLVITKRGRKIASSYSWDTMTELTLEQYQESLKHTSR